MTTDYRSIINDPDALAALRAAAHRERAREMHRLVVAPLLAVFKAGKPRASRMIHRRAYC